ncbi:MAG: cytochrome c biogenesis CcdA family protein [bacterium]|nr:cytochrome c biogenesis CcdA family protein [bacterium]
MKRAVLFLLLLAVALPMAAAADTTGDESPSWTETQTADFSLLGILVAIVMGLFTFITPCVLPVVPAFISYMSGLSLGQITGKELEALPADEKRELKRMNRRKMVKNALFFAIGVIIVYVLIGVVFGVLGIAFSPASPARIWVFRVLGAVVVLFGVHMTGLVRIPFLDFLGGGGTKGGGGSAWQSVVMGLSFAFAFSACTMGFFGGIMGMAMTKSNIFGAVFLAAAYGLGLAIPFILTALAVDAFFGFFNRIKKHMKVVEIVGGLLLIALGVLMILDLLQAVLAF